MSFLNQEAGEGSKKEKGKRKKGMGNKGSKAQRDTKREQWLKIFFLFW